MHRPICRSSQVQAYGAAVTQLINSHDWAENDSASAASPVGCMGSGRLARRHAQTCMFEAGFWVSAPFCYYPCPAQCPSEALHSVLCGASPGELGELVAKLCLLRARLRALVEPPSATEEGRKQQLQDWGWGLCEHGVKPLWRKLSEEQQEVSIPLCREGSAASPAQQKCMCRVTSAVPT